MNQPIEVSTKCYQSIEEWLEEYYNTFPYKRIYENGERLGYKGFIRNFTLDVEEIIQGVVEVKVVYRDSGEVHYKECFDMWHGLLQTPEKQGYLL